MLTPTQLIAQNIETLRKKAGLTQHDLAISCQRMGLNWNQSHISRAESGGTNVILRVDVLIILAAALGASPGNLLLFDDDDSNIQVGQYGKMNGLTFSRFFSDEVLYHRDHPRSTK